jgi:uncharacterized membrane protein/osmotically-inducible protein OsmY
MDNQKLPLKSSLAKGVVLLTGAGFGAGLMYYLDPQRGRRRRTLARDQAGHVLSKTGNAAIAAGQDAAHRLYGKFAEASSAFGTRGVPDEVLVERVRSKLGRYLSHPSSLEVSAHGGRITLHGRISANEVPSILSAVHAIRGVQGVINALQSHDQAEHISDLQGTARTGEPFEWLQQSWSPAARAAASIAGVALMTNCLIKRTPAAVALGTVGFGLCARGLTNIETKQLLGLGRGRHGIDVHSTIVINAPVEKVFRFMSDPQNYPLVSSSFKSVQTLGDGRYQKTLVGPAGLEIQLEEILTRRLWNHLVAWKSGSHSQIKYEKSARFTPLAPEKTQIDFLLSYNPPAGIVGHSAAWLAGLDPKKLLDDILKQAKLYLETGQLPGDATAPQSKQFQQPGSSTIGSVDLSHSDGSQSGSSQHSS